MPTIDGIQYTLLKPGPLTEYLYLPPIGEFIIICGHRPTVSASSSTASAGARLSNGPHPYAFGVRIEDLSKASSLFSDILDSTGGTQYVTAEESCHVVSLVLSGMLEVYHAHLDGCRDWGRLHAALLLARKWQCPGARTAIFHAILAKVSDVSRGFVSGVGTTEVNVIDVLAEASTFGDSSLALAETAFATRAAQKKPFALNSVQLSQLYYMELGLERYSKVVDALVRLTSQGAFTRSKT